MTIDDLADLLKRRGADSVTYFHTDHFEPWSLNIDEESARAVDRMAELARSSPYARRLSLFYSVFLPYRLASSQAVAEGDSRVPDDEVVFFARSARQEELAREAIRPLVCEDAHEMHLHVHHEFWTRNHSHFDTPVSRWVNASSTAEADRRRLDLNFRLCREAIAREIGRPFERWAFIHGNWALNASDPLICHVTNEMAMIMAHGGYGDFSFPAGRSYCDPKLKAPFTCLPLDLVRAYDDPKADQKVIGAGSPAFARDRFFIWNAPISSTDSSLDYYSAANREKFRAPDRLVAAWLSRSFLLGRRIFIKTHAHSMNAAYRLNEPESVIPHCYPDIVRVFECLAQVCERARVELRFETANEVVGQLATLDGGENPLKSPLPQWTVPSRPAPQHPAANATTATAAEPSVPPPQQVPAETPQQIAAATPQQVADELRDLHQRWLQTESGARQVDELYARKLRNNSPLEAYERVLATYISERYPADATRIIEIGSGWSGLVILLARLGFEVLGFEGNVARHAAGQWHVAEQIRRYPALQDVLRFPRQGLFPEAFSEADLAAGKINLCIATNITSSYSASHEAQMIEAATACDELILDLGRFGTARNKQADRDSFLGLLTSSAFKPVERLFFAGPYEYWRLRSQSMPGRRRKDGAACTANAGVATRSMADVLPLVGRRGLLCTQSGDRKLSHCPVCRSPDIVPLWAIPMATLDKPLQVFGSYFTQIPTLQTPASIHSFDFCRACESIFLNPVPSSQKAGYRDSDHFLRTMQGAAEWKTYETAYNRFERWIPADATVMLDAACGIGHYLEIARRRDRQRWKRLVGLELSTKYVEHLRKAGFEAHAFDIDKDALHAIAPRDSVDFVIFAEAFEHVDHPLDALQKLMTVLRPGGRLFFTAQRYGPDTTAAVRPEEPIYVGETLIEDLPHRLGCRIVDKRLSAIRYYVVLEK